MPEQQTQTQDPLDLAQDLLIEALKELPQFSLDPQKSEAARNIILLAQAVASVDSARSLRVIASMQERAHL